MNTTVSVSVSSSFSMYRRGFTLVELMIVIAIIWVLSATLFPMMSGYMARSRDTALMTQVKKFNAGMEIYFNDKGQYFDSPDVLLNTLSGVFVPYYVDTLPSGINKDKHRYYSRDGSGPNYKLLIFTETMYGSWQTTRGHTCITGISAGKPVVYWSNSWSDGVMSQPICTFQ